MGENGKGAGSKAPLLTEPHMVTERYYLGNAVQGYFKLSDIKGGVFYFLVMHCTGVAM